MHAGCIFKFADVQRIVDSKNMNREGKKCSKTMKANNGIKNIPIRSSL